MKRVTKAAISNDDSAAEWSILNRKYSPASTVFEFCRFLLLISKV